METDAYCPECGSLIKWDEKPDHTIYRSGACTFSGCGKQWTYFTEIVSNRKRVFVIEGPPAETVFEAYPSSIIGYIMNDPYGGH